MSLELLRGLQLARDLMCPWCADGNVPADTFVDGSIVVGTHDVKVRSVEGPHDIEIESRRCQATQIRQVLTEFGVSGRIRPTDSIIGRRVVFSDVAEPDQEPFTVVAGFSAPSGIRLLLLSKTNSLTEATPASLTVLKR